MKVVLDTNVLISSTLWDKSVAQKLLFAIIKKDVEIFSSQEILAEYKRILIEKFKISVKDAEYLLDRLCSIIKFVEPKERVVFIKDDIEDDKILECAVEANAQYIITYDKHLLNILEFRGIRIIKPEEFLSRYRSLN